MKKCVLDNDAHDEDDDDVGHGDDDVTDDDQVQHAARETEYLR